MWHTPASEGFDGQMDRLLRAWYKRQRCHAERNTIYVPIKFHLGAKNDGSGRVTEGNVLGRLHCD
ncbi:MAG: hypothetical protein R2795_16750 [Saprospiraceae bacterium]